MLKIIKVTPRLARPKRERKHLWYSIFMGTEPTTKNSQHELRQQLFDAIVDIYTGHPVPVQMSEASLLECCGRLLNSFKDYPTSFLAELISDFRDLSFDTVVKHGISKNLLLLSEKKLKNLAVSQVLLFAKQLKEKGKDRYDPAFGEIPLSLWNAV